jgi:hypothetical protein
MDDSNLACSSAVDDGDGDAVAIASGVESAEEKSTPAKVEVTVGSAGVENVAGVVYMYKSSLVLQLNKAKAGEVAKWRTVENVEVLKIGRAVNPLDRLAQQMNGYSSGHGGPGMVVTLVRNETSDVSWTSHLTTTGLEMETWRCNACLHSSRRARIGVTTFRTSWVLSPSLLSVIPVGMSTPASHWRYGHVD